MLHAELDYYLNCASPLIRSCLTMLGSLHVQVRGKGQVRAPAQPCSPLPTCLACTNPAANCCCNLLPCGAHGSLPLFHICTLVPNLHASVQA